MSIAVAGVVSPPMAPGAAQRESASAEGVEVAFDAARLIAQPAGETVAVILPGVGPITLVKKRMQVLPSGNLAWEGHLPAPYEHFGAELIVTRDGVVGDIRTPSGSVRIEPSATMDRKSSGSVRAVPLARDPHEQCRHEAHPADAGISHKSKADGVLPVAALVAQALASKTVAEVDLLFVYTPEALRRFGSTARLAAAIDGIVLAANAAAARSDLALKFRAAATVSLPLVRPVTGDLTALLTAVTSGDDASLVRDDAFLSAAKARAQYGADAVVLLSAPADTTVGCDAGKPCTVGAAWQATVEGLWASGAGKRAYLAVNVYASDLNRTVVHELGHLFGAGHDTDTGGGGLFTDSQAAVWDAGASGTVMSYASNAVMMFSNAAVACNGQPCGGGATVATDNAKTLRATRLAVSSLRERQWWTANLDGLWWDPSRPGWGVQLAVRGDRVDALWFAYDAAGTPTWYVVEDCRIEENICRAEVMRYWTAAARARFADAADPKTMLMSRAGELVLDLSETEAPRWRTVMGGETMDGMLSRQGVPPTGAASGWSGNWWLSWETATGLGATETPTGLFLVWFGYDVRGTAGWRIVPDCRFNADKTRCDGALYITQGPPHWGVEGSQPSAAIGVSRLGDAGVRLVGPGQARLRWTEGDTGGEADVVKLME